MDLESENPSVETPPEPPPPVQAQTPPPPTEPEEPDAVDVSGEKMVPLANLIELRRQAKEYKAKADQFDQTVQYVNQVRPYIEFLQQNPNLMQRTQEQPPTPQTQVQPVDEAAEELARTLDLYTADGKPDVIRAQKLQKVIDRTAETRSQAAIKPLQESTVRERSAYQYQRALATNPNVNRQMLDALWSRTDPNITSTEEGAAGTLAMVLGLEELQRRLSGQPPQGVTPVVQPPSHPPLVTEAPGGRTVTRQPLTSIDQTIMRLRGMDEKTYLDRAKGFQSGRPNVLED